MKEIIYLVVDKSKVDRMTKRLPSLYRGEIPIKVTVTIDPKAFKEPVVEQAITINDWQDGIDMADVEFRTSFITPEEASTIRRERLAKMRAILEEQGFKVAGPDDEEQAEAANV